MHNKIFTRFFLTLSGPVEVTHMNLSLVLPFFLPIRSKAAHFTLEKKLYFLLFTSDIIRNTDNFHFVHTLRGEYYCCHGDQVNQSQRCCFYNTRLSVCRLRGWGAWQALCACAEKSDGNSMIPASSGHLLYMGSQCKINKSHFHLSFYWF